MPSTQQKHFFKGTYMALAIITLAGAFLRFYNLEGTSLFNDELSALTRIRYNSISEVIRQGSMILDTHPAGIQVFLYYYTKIFGIDAFTVRLPFAIAGVLCIPLSFVVFRNWFGVRSALFTSAAVALLQFPIYYSQLARLYTPGLLFCLCLMLSFTWLNIKSRNILYSVAFAVFAALCAYTHYFAMLFAGLLWLTGFAFIAPAKRKYLFFAGLGAAILFLPHIKITLFQLQKGGLSWLGKPGWDYIFHYIFYIFNESWFVLIAAFAIFIVSVIYASTKKWFSNRYRLLAVLLFFLLYIIGFLKSYYGQPVLQYSTLIFAFPLLPAFLFSYLDEIRINKTIFYSLLICWCVLCGWSTVQEKKYYETEHYGQFKPLADKMLQWNTKFGENNILRVYNTYNPFYIEYYLKHKTPVAQYRTDQPRQMDSLFQLVKNSDKKYLCYGWSNINNPQTIYDIIQLKYNILQDEAIHFNSDIKLFKKPDSMVEIKPKQAFSSAETLLQKPYKGTLKNALARITYDFTAEELAPEIDIAAALETTSGENTFWAAIPLQDAVPENVKGRQRAVWFVKLPPEGQVLKIFIWNRTKLPLHTHNFAVEFY